MSALAKYENAIALTKRVRAKTIARRRRAAGPQDLTTAQRAAKLWSQRMLGRVLDLVEQLEGQHVNDTHITGRLVAGCISVVRGLFNHHRLEAACGRYACV
jgi:hypothetical protein